MVVVAKWLWHGSAIDIVRLSVVAGHLERVSIDVASLDPGLQGAVSILT